MTEIEFTAAVHLLRVGRLFFGFCEVCPSGLIKAAEGIEIRI